MVTPPTKLPTHDPTPLEPRHKWGEATYAGERAERTERLCALCGLVKITVHPPQGFPYREWRTRAGKPWQGDNTPPCLPERKPETKSLP